MGSVHVWNSGTLSQAGGTVLGAVFWVLVIRSTSYDFEEPRDAEDATANLPPPATAQHSAPSAKPVAAVKKTIVVLTTVL